MLPLSFVRTGSIRLSSKISVKQLRKGHATEAPSEIRADSQVAADPRYVS